ncbi:MAG: hypothetical protein KF689_13010 [Gemmatimonadaceae bacterium]|nr:hypothetical protein [Gemmatimonadaceae bacterium]MCW5827096.1 hypothetical protein [Gemmatimonadaceae bacterium]
MPYSVKNQVIRNADGQIKFWVPSEGGREHYHVGLWIEATPEELDRIEEVEYELDPSFRRRVRRSANRDNKFGITIWTWGMFEVGVKIHLHGGEVRTLSYYLSYELPPDTGDNYAQVAE